MIPIINSYCSNKGKFPLDIYNPDSQPKSWFMQCPVCNHKIKVRLITGINKHFGTNEYFGMIAKHKFR